MQKDRRLPSQRTLVLIALMVAAIALFSVLVPIQAFYYGTPVALAIPLGAALCGSPLISLIKPRLAIVLFCLAAIALPLAVQPTATWPWPWSVPAMLAFVMFIVVITIRHGWRYGAIPLSVAMAGSLVLPLLSKYAVLGERAGVDLIVTASVASASFLVAVLIEARLRVGAELDKVRELSAAEQARRVLVEERTRIARELHDVIAHSMSVIQVQASTAKYRLQDVSTEAEAEFDEIASVARGSLTEMRRLLGVLRTEEQTPQLAPQQGIDDIENLVESIRRAGATVALHYQPTAGEISPSVQIASYRIVQEALSNAMRHAPEAPISVTVDATGDQVKIRVTNGEGTGIPAAAGSGHGLRGMQERVTLLGGTLAVGPDASGGWTVSALLPLAVNEGPA